MVRVTPIGVPTCLSCRFSAILLFVGGKKQPNHGRFAMVLRRRYRRDAAVVGDRSTLSPN